MSEFLDILSIYEQEYQAFVQICSRLKDGDRLKDGVCGFWSPKQVVDHLTGWNREAYTQFIKIKNGEAVDLEYDDDTFNARAVADRAALNWDESLKDLDDARIKLTDFAKGLTSDELTGSGVYSNWVQGMAEDFQVHKGQLQVWVREPDL
jgi:hypothetical protein